MLCASEGLIIKIGLCFFSKFRNHKVSPFLFAARAASLEKNNRVTTSCRDEITMERGGSPDEIGALEGENPTRVCPSKFINRVMKRREL
ncbi:MAG: hypothetical protein A3F54_02635 [Candidatus Kerfeldbacteria bacterium RIFCSPHIGHO2_12_FULL_48_17]|uniref:Uncharacterized protein n=1 Tax=Candidatus Kerfeldbacteria bacterium RIFCSPHIGHO2_12_FULL_48_17 TaxID=1798542 RepID=A0A1G2AYB0_9BACT|nr:MAG: hypothetical protein A3F54_02635 [Candidatus Kerfeldbacteria bacterium RIFCSPHIGHO2_12_FULL_48_17]